MKILIIDDDKCIGAALQSFLKNQGFTVDYVSDPEQGLFLIKTNYYDCILLDYIMPQITGDNVCQTIRSEKIYTPIIIISVKETAPDKITLLNSGADYYLPKPFNLNELLALINAATRRPYTYQEKKAIKIKDIYIDPVSFSVTKDNKKITLTPKEFDLLYFLAQHPNKLFTRHIILEKIWDQNVNLFSNTVDVHILRLRKKLNSEQLIETISGRGYKINS